MMSEHDSSSKIPTAQTIGDENSKSEEDVQQDIGNEDEGQLSPRTERLLKIMNDQTRSALQEQRIEFERKLLEVQNPVNAKKQDAEGPKPVNDDVPNPKSDRPFFKTFRSSGATEFSGQTDPVLAMQWVENTEKVFRVVYVREEDKVRYATATLTDRALTWWNATYRSTDPNTRDRMTWEEFQVLFFEQYCPDDLKQKLEKEFLELKHKSMSVIEYETEFKRKLQFAQRFVPSEKDKINHFVAGLRRNIRDFVTNREISSFTKAVEYARKRGHDLSLPDDSDVPEKTLSTPTSKSSRFFTPRRAQSQNTPHTSSRAYTMQSNAPRNCNRCGKSHQGRCGGDQTFLRCFCCGEVGHVRTQCPQKERACYSCGVLGHRIRECPKNRPEESRGSVQQPRQQLTQAMGASIKKEEVPKPRARAFQITTEEAVNDPDVVTVADRIFRDCSLVLENHDFLVDLIPIDIRGFDVVIGMDWLIKNRAVIICYERMVQVPVKNRDYLYIYGERRTGDVKIISMLKTLHCITKGCTSFMAYVLDATKEVNKMVKDVPIVCEYPDVFPDDLPGLPPDR
ncbi:hypothetical protein OSB04_000554 [Centaurea solstitialis]|uniref:CCHC-type domain-containing protein n=1 Tax=Centaurea solstitialis TaxID=347529 RepID=A0AA38TWS4_9ASTR|nr:hypothetical protein OSB04_000554 [Centaurea solstitialis]